MTFAKPDLTAFPLLDMAKRAFFAGGACPAVLNAADEVAVAAFLDGRIRFVDIPRIVIGTYDMMGGARFATSVEDIIAADKEARRVASSYLK